MKLRLWFVLCWLVAAANWFLDLQVIPRLPKAADGIQQTEWLLLLYACPFIFLIFVLKFCLFSCN